MIKEIQIKNFLTIKDARISFSDKITCFTGESGAGKSVLASVLIFLFGKDIKAKNGLKNALVAAKIGSDVISERLYSLGFKTKREFCLTRKFSDNRRSRFFIDDKPIGKDIVQSIFLPYLITTHQNVNYLRSETYLELLSDFDMSSYNRKFEQWIRTQKDYSELNQQIIKDKEKYEQYKEQIAKIKTLKPYKDEISELRKRINSLKSARKIKEIDSQINSLLQDAKLLEQLIIFKRLLAQKEELQGGDLSEKLNEIIIALENGEFQIENSQTSEDLEKMKRRLSDLRMLEFQMRLPLDEIIDGFAKMNEFVKRYDEQLLELSDMKQQTEKLHEQVIKVADSMHDRRLRAASDLENKLKKTLNNLGIDCSIYFSFTKIEPNRFGTDKISLLFSPNPQIEPQDVNHIASGGEKSRILLALLSIQTKNQILILDEIDEGTSGAAVEKIASTIKLISRHCQIVLITHKPQIASIADIHYRVSKFVEDDQAVTKIKRVSRKERADEIASLISTETSTEEAKRYAHKLLED